MHFASYYRWLVFRHLFGTPHSATILDIGSNDGGFLRRVPASFKVAIDTSRDVLRAVHADGRVCADGTEAPFREVSFDHVILSDVIEHVPADQSLVSEATKRVKPGGHLWLSTTASDFQLFPRQITPRAERSWGHVRKGYSPERLRQLIGDDFACEIVEWPEVVFRNIYVLVWLCSKWVPAVSRVLAMGCFWLDRRLLHMSGQHGHIYIQARRHAIAG